MSTMSQRLFLTLCVASTLLACNKAVDLASRTVELSEGDHVTVVEAIKGDEVRVQKDGASARLRLLGLYSMDEAVAPVDPGAAEGLAASLLTTQVVGKVVVVRLNNPPTDTHGRFLGYLDANGKDLNLALLEGGRVIVYTEFPFDREMLYLRAEAQARAAGRGLWRRVGFATLAQGLRKQWLAERTKRGQPAPDDELLTNVEPSQP